MNIETVVVGELGCNCYVLSIDNKVLVIDPGDEFNKIKNIVGNRDVVGVLITHYHFDHIGALEDVLNYYQTKLYAYNNLEEKEYNIDSFNFNVIKTPGHKSDAITFYFRDDKVMFVGDFIFKDNIGRCDLETGDVIKMQQSIEKIKEYEDDIVIYPGHGEVTSLRSEKENNYYFNNKWF